MKTNLCLLMLCAVYFPLGTSSFGQELLAQSLSEHDPQIQEAAYEDGDSAVLSESMLIREIEQSELAMYALFNDLNSSDEYDVICETKQVGSEDIAALFCEPAFLENLRKQVADEQANNSSTGTGFFARIRNTFTSQESRAQKLVKKRAAEPTKLLLAEMESLAASNPLLAEKIQTFGESQQTYLSAVKQERLKRAYVMRQNDPTYGQAFQSSGRTAHPRPWLSAPPPGQTQPRIHFPADRYPNR